jgi:hypothetical protein
VAAVKIRRRPGRPDGTVTTDQNEGSPLHVLSEEDGAWRITAGQNTLVLQRPCNDFTLSPKVQPFEPSQLMDQVMSPLSWPPKLFHACPTSVGFR